VVLPSIAIFESLSLIHFVAPHNTTLYYFLFYVRCQDMCLRVYGVATVHRQCKVQFIYTLIIYPAKRPCKTDIV